MATRLHIDLSTGALEVESEQEFVEKIYNDYKAILHKRIEASPPPQQHLQQQTSELRKRSAAKKGAPSCADRVVALKGEKFFATLRSATDIREKLSEKGTTYAANLVSATLNQLTKRGELRRVKQDGTWKYQNP